MKIVITENQLNQLKSGLGKKKDIESTRIEWSKVNNDLSNDYGFGESIDPNQNTARQKAFLNAQTSVLKKHKIQKVTGVSTKIKNEKIFQIENNQYHSMMVVELYRMVQNASDGSIKEIPFREK